MAKEIVYEIKDNYKKFEELFKKEKIINDNIIILKEKGSNKDWLLGDSSIQIETDSKDILFIAEKKKLDNKYGLKYRCESFYKKPYFRFDSDGPAHRNYIENIPLEEQKITTPHFNTYNKDGISIAYKNEILKDDEKAKIIAEDINFGVSLFCQETNSKTINDEFPQIILNETTLDFNYQEMINLDNLTFE